ncbi:hypothetical protein [Anaerovibrio slackiae]|uniref:hypothetical protein n=1 Tax=Anaerovibrio slackiae TaxID=2652309 RepID=UPI00386CC53C
MDKHKTVRNHIAAAKGWLSQAEESLEQENDIRGDLNLMLAQAELRSAQEKQPQKAWMLWSRRLLPLAAALCIAAGYVAYLRPEPKVPAVPPAMPVAAERTVEAGREAGSASIEPVAGDYHEAPVAAVPEMAVAESPDQGRDALLHRQVAGTEAVPEASGQEAKPAAVQAAVPDIELQKLMQAAGNVLRE